MEIELMPCPFCGSEDIKIKTEKAFGMYHSKVYCNNAGCGCESTFIWGDNLEWTEWKASTVWNRRADNE